jgi:hypothetical protein
MVSAKQAVFAVLPSKIWEGAMEYQNKVRRTETNGTYCGSKLRLTLFWDWLSGRTGTGGVH